MTTHAVGIGCESTEEKNQVQALINEFKVFCNTWTEAQGRELIALQSGVPENVTQKILESFWDLAASGEGSDKEGMGGISLACQYGIFLGMKMNKKSVS